MRTLHLTVALVVALLAASDVFAQARQRWPGGGGGQQREGQAERGGGRERPSGGGQPQAQAPPRQSGGEVRGGGRTPQPAPPAARRREAQPREVRPDPPVTASADRGRVRQQEGSVSQPAPQRSGRTAEPRERRVPPAAPVQSAGGARQTEGETRDTGVRRAQPRVARIPPAARADSDAGVAQAQQDDTSRRAQPRVQRAPTTATQSVAGAATRAQRDDDARRAVPRVSRPRGDNVATGVAVPRASYPAARVIDRGRVARRTVLVPRTTVFYNNYYYAYPRYYYPRRHYPFGFGAFGIGYYYYDPYVWYPHHSYRFTGYGYGYPTGELRLDVSPRHAEVYVDGYFAGIVDDFDGIFQALRLEEGPYRIEIVAPGYEPIEFDVRIQPGRKITYRQDLLPALQP